MLYRIRYRDEISREGLELIEANSPNEAIVKFRCMRDRRNSAEPRQVSVCQQRQADNPEY